MQFKLHRQRKSVIAPRYAWVSLTIIIVVRTPYRMFEGKIGEKPLHARRFGNLLVYLWSLLAVIV